MNSNIERIIVPQGKCPLESIAEQGKKTENAWIFMNMDTVNYLKKNAIIAIEHNGYTFNIGGRIVRVRDFTKEWYILDEVIIGNGIHEFKGLTPNPERTFCVEMA